MKLRCAHCGEIIGVYEPMIARIGTFTIRTSLAGAPDISDEARCFHTACFGHGGQEPSAGPQEPGAST